MTYADTPKVIQERRRAFLRKRRLHCPAMATSLEKTGDRLFAVLRLPSSQWKSERTVNAIERPHRELKQRIRA